MPKKSTSSITVTIEKIVAGGYGLARLPDGKVVLTPLVLPEEEVRVQPIRRRKDFIEARLVEILHPSSLRIEPFCSYYGRCGGCDLQHTPAANQLLLKTAILREQLLRANVVSEEAGLAGIWSEPFPSPSPFGYRQRIRLQVDEDGCLGYFQCRSHTVEPVRHCLLAAPEINTVLEQALYSSPMAHLLENCRALEFFLSPADGSIILYLHFSRKPRPADNKAVREVQEEIAAVKGLVLEVDGFGVFSPPSLKKGKAPEKDLAVRIPLSKQSAGKEIVLSCEPGGFYQVNREVNEELVRTVRDWTAVSGEERVLDLFCGMGNFSLPLALQAGEVVGLDLQRAAIRSATKNAAAANLTNCRFEKGSAVEGAARLTASGELVDLILLDPPRTGCSEVIPYIPEFGAQRIIYVACDPATLARDLALLDGFGYQLSRVRVVDMFPQTHHMETVALLEKR